MSKSKSYNVIEVTNENKLNKIIKSHKVDGGNSLILYHSLWDEPSTILVEKIKAKSDPNSDTNLYLINSFDTPHSFVIYNVTSVPYLVSIKGTDLVQREGYLPNIYHKLGIGISKSRVQK